MTITINGTDHQLPPLIVAMVSKIVESQKAIVQQGYGTVSIDYAPKHVVLKLLKLQYTAKG